MVLLIAAGTVPLYIDTEKMEKWAEGEPIGSELDKTLKSVHIITHIIIIPLNLLYSIFLPLKLGTFWFYAGLPICLIGIVMVLIFGISFLTAPLGEPISKGVYAISRHPAYFGYFLGFVGIGIASASWIFLLSALVWIISWHVGVAEEERILIEKYGDAYREYMNRTPKWIGFLKAK